MMRTGLFIAIIVIAGTAGEIAVTYAIKRVGEVKTFRLPVLVRVIGRIFQSGWTWIGIGLMTISFFSLLALLSWADVSFVVPATALSYVSGALGARFLLKERIVGFRWAGVVLVCLGVALLSLG